MLDMHVRSWHGRREWVPQAAIWVSKGKTAEHEVAIVRSLAQVLVLFQFVVVDDHAPVQRSVRVSYLLAAVAHP